MRYEDFVLRQLKRNARVYSVCMKVFLAFMILFTLVLIGCLVSRIGIEITIFDVILMLFIAVEYPSFKRLKEQSEFASAEIEAALATPGFQIPEDYTDEEDPQQDPAGTEEADDLRDPDGRAGFNLFRRKRDADLGLFFFWI